MVDGSRVKPGQIVVGLASSGVHSNGFSLVRKVLLEHRQYALDSPMPELGKTLADELLTPTAIYVKPILELLDRVNISAMAHITGGGFQGNIPRVLPDNCCATIRIGSWHVPPIFPLIAHDAGLDDEEMLRTFNMGIGMIVVVAPSDVDMVLKTVQNHGMNAVPIGEIAVRSAGSDPIRFL